MAAAELFANTPATVVSSGGTDAPASGTVETWTVASSSEFPAAATGVTQFHAGDPEATSEIIAVTNVSGTTWTVTRGAESTTPVAHSAGFTVQQVVSAGPLGSFAQTGLGDLGGTGDAPTVVSTHLAAPMPTTQGGTGQDAASSSALLTALGALASANNLSDVASESTALANLGGLPLAGGTLSASLTVEGALVTPPVTLTDAASISVNAAASDTFTVTLGGNRTLANPTSPTSGQPITIEVIQDSTGSRTLAYGGAYYFPQSIGTPVLSATPGARDFLAFRYNSDDTTWYCVGFVPAVTSAVPATVSQGGTGQGSLTAYELIAGGTTTTGAVQQIAAGSSGNVLTSGGGSALPSFTALDSTAADITPTGTASAAGATGKVPDAGHIHPSSLTIPSDFGYAAWTFDPGYCNAAAQVPSSLLILTKFWVRQATPLNDVYTHITSAATGTLVTGQNFYAVFDMGGTQRAVTADLTSSWGSTGVRETAWVTPYTAPAGAYFFGVLCNVAGAGPTWRASAGISNGLMLNAGLSGANLRVCTQTAGTVMPATLNYSSNVQTNSIPFCAVFV